MRLCPREAAERSAGWRYLGLELEEGSTAAYEGRGRQSCRFLGLCVGTVIAARGIFAVSRRAPGLRSTSTSVGDDLTMLAPATKIEVRVPAGVGNLQSAVRTWMLAQARPVHFLLEPGTHYVNETLSLDSRASGFSFSGTGATISGGIAMHGKWVAAGGTARGNVQLWKASLPADFNVSDIGATWQLWRGHKRMTCAKSPTRKIVTTEQDDAISAKWDFTTMVKRDSFEFYGDDIKAAYRNMADVRLLMYRNWDTEYVGLKSIDASAHVADLASPSLAWWWVKKGSGGRYYVVNAFEELDEADEFYIDRSERAVYIGVEGFVDPNEGTDPFILAAGPRELVSIKGYKGAFVHGVSFSDLEFAHTAVEEQGWVAQSGNLTTTAMVHAKFARDISFAACTFRATGGYGLWADVHTSEISVTGSLFTDLGAGGIRTTGSSNELTSGKHTFSDNTITNGGHWFQEGVGILAQYVGNVTITHNEISYMRYSGVSTGWTWGYGATIDHDIRVAFNHIHHIGLGYLTDMACVYTLGYQPGSTVTNNYCHDVQSYDYGGWAYYTDEGSRGIVFENNIAHLTKCAGHHQHYGTDNVITNNLYVDVNIGDMPTPGRPEILVKSCDAAIKSSTHDRDLNTCPDPSKTPQAADCCCHLGCADQGKCSSWLFTKNIVYLSRNSTSTFVRGTPSVGLRNLSFENNTYFSKRGNRTSKMFDVTDSGEARADLADWQGQGKDQSSQIADPQLGPNFTIADESPALRLGFKPINVSTVGPRTAFCGAPHKRRILSSSESVNVFAPLLSATEHIGSLIHGLCLPGIAPCAD